MNEKSKRYLSCTKFTLNYCLMRAQLIELANTIIEGISFEQQK